VDLRWRNPRLHDESRVKHWLACDAHADSLGSFLSARGFLLDRGPFSVDADSEPARGRRGVTDPEID
jgi:hypothetical protein